MNHRAILVTGIGGDIGENIVKCLAEGGLGLDIYGSDVRAYSPGKRLVKEFFLAPLARDMKEYSAFIGDMVRKQGIKYVFPSSETEIEFFKNNRREFAGSGVTIMINDDPVLDQFMDKYATVKFLERNNIQAPKTFLPGEYNGGLPYPFLLKKRKGSGSKLVLIIENAAEFEFYREKYIGEDLIIQEYLGNKDQEYTVGVYANEDDVFSIGFRRYLASDAGVTIYAELVQDQGIHDLAERIACACGLRGVLNIQARKTEKGYIPFEINPRISGTSYVRHQFGFTDVLWWLLNKEGKKTVYVPRYTSGVAVRTISETFFDLGKELVGS